MKKNFPRAVWWALIGLAFIPGVRAVEDGSTTDTTAPMSSDSSAYEAWNYVGSVGSASGVYIGDYGGTYWVLTASHVGAGTFTLTTSDGTTYTYTLVADTTYSDFTTTISGTTYTADLTLYEITGSGEALAYLSSLSNLSLGTTQLSTNTSLLMIGYGGGKSWATNTPTGLSLFTGTYDSATSVGIVTASSGGGQGVDGDSGGGEFVVQNGQLVLAGILAGITTDYTTTYAVDLAYYSSQILSDINATVAAIPEPASIALGLGGVALGLGLWRRHRFGMPSRK